MLPRRLPALALLLAALGAAPSCARDERSFQHGGLKRSYRLHVPQPAPTGPAPLVLSLHGRLGTAAGMQRTTRYDALSDRDGVVVAYPDGVDRSWADGRGVSSASQQGIDDVAFLLALIEEVNREVPIDPDRVTLMGISNGGFMAQTVACAQGQALAAAASIVATLPKPLADTCAPPRPLAMLFMNGTADPAVPFEGGSVSSDVGGEILSSDASAAHWVAHDACAGPPERTTIDAVDDGTRIVLDRWTGCEGGSRVDYYVVEGGGHTWPGGSQYLPEGTIGKASEELDGVGAIWDFLVAQKRSPAR